MTDRHDNPATVTTALDDIAGVVDALEQAKLDAADAKERRERLEATLKDRLTVTGATVGQIGGRDRVLWTEYETSSFDVKALRADQPELAEKYTRHTVSRRFSLTSGNTTTNQNKEK